MADTATLSLAERKKLFAAAADKPAAKPVAKPVAVAKAVPPPEPAPVEDASISGSGRIGSAKPKAVKAPAGFASFSPIKSTPKPVAPAAEPAPEPKAPALKATAKPVAVAASITTPALTPEKAGAKPSPLKAVAKPVAVPADSAPTPELKPTAKPVAAALKPKVAPAVATPEQKPINTAVSPLLKAVGKPAPAVVADKHMSADSPSPAPGASKKAAALSLPKLPHTSGGIDELPPSPRLKSPRFSREGDLLKWAGEAHDDLSVNHLPAGSSEDLPPAPPPMPPPDVLAQMTAAAGLPPPPPAEVPSSPRFAPPPKLGRAPAPPVEALLDTNTGARTGSKGPVMALAKPTASSSLSDTALLSARTDSASAKAAAIVTKLPEKAIEPPVVHTPPSAATTDAGDKRNRRRAFKVDANALGDELPLPAAAAEPLRTASDSIETHTPAPVAPVPEEPVEEPVAEPTEEADEHNDEHNDEYNDEQDPNAEEPEETVNAMAQLDEVAANARPRLDNNLALTKISGPRKGKRRPPKKKRPADAIAVERAPERKEVPEEDEEGGTRKAVARPYASAYAGAPPGGMALPGMGGPMGLKMPAFDPSAIKSKLKSSAPPAVDGAKKPPAASPAVVMPTLKPTAKGLSRTMT